MEGMSRVKKYQDLRDQITNGEVDSKEYDVNEIEEQNGVKAVKETVAQVDDEEDTFAQSIQKFPKYELDGDLSIDSNDLTEEKQEEALTRVRENSNGVTLNTRLDILNQIMLANAQSSLNINHSKVTPASSSTKEKPVVEKKSEKTVEKMEEEKEVKEVEEVKDEDFNQTISDIIKGEKLAEEVNERLNKKEVVRFDDEDEDEEDYEEDEDLEEDDEEEEESGLFEKILTVLIVILFIGLVALIGYIIKVFLFSQASLFLLK